MRDSNEVTASGLRMTKYRRTKEKLLSTAAQVFRNDGVRAARLSEIARRCEVSQATLFNYFPNKQSLAEGWVRGEIEGAIEQAVEAMAERGLRPMMRNVCVRIASDCAKFDERAIRLEAWRETGRAKQPTVHGSASLLERAVAREQESERVRADVSAAVLGDMLIDSLEGGLIAGMREDWTESRFTKALQERVDLILDGARKKNERVAAPSARPAAKTWTTRPVQST